MPEDSATTNILSQISIGILAGGEGRRVNGEDKGLLRINQQPLIEYLVAALKPALPSAPLMISANRNIERYQNYGQVVRDNPNTQGPLAGLAALLNACQTEWLLTLPCDCPRLPPNFCEKMAQSLLHGSQDRPQIDGAVAHDGNQQQNAVLLIRQTALGSLQQQLENGGGAIHRWLQTLNIATVTFNHWPAHYWNANTLEQLQALIDSPEHAHTH